MVPGEDAASFAADLSDQLKHDFLQQLKDTNSYERWRAGIHRQLEDDLQRQVKELLEQSEERERLNRLRQQQLRAGQRLPFQQSEVDIPQGVPWSEIERRNRSVLCSNTGKDAHEPREFVFNDNYLNNHALNGSFDFDALGNYRRRRRFSMQSNDCLSQKSFHFQKLSESRSPFAVVRDESSLLAGNSIVKSNKADLLHLFEQRSSTLSSSNNSSSAYVNRNGVVITEDGPFWPGDCRILHPTPKLHTREIIAKEPIAIPDVGRSSSSTKNQQTFDNQPALQKYTDTFRHATVVYDADKSPRKQEPKPPESELSCPPLIFESRFECGNLQQAKRVGPFEYELVLRPDLYTRRHTQWYYFRVQNMIANVTYRFRIINLMKRGSLYQEGMKILLFSELAKKREQQGWHRVGHHINYSEYKPRTYNSLLDRDINYFELDFQLEFFYSGDTCYISHCYPYTFTDLKDDLDHLSAIRPRDIFRRDVLCESQAGNSCFIITVTDESVPIKQKKFVLITARIHPGETNASYMMRGVLEFITSDDEIAKRLRSQLVFKIVPMLNPDGVIIGNYRCSLTGKDMNRNFRHPHKQTFPTIYHIKELVHSLQKERREILAFCDLHGHSRKSNVFAYGCDGCDGPQPDMRNFLSARVLPFIMSKTAPDMFAFDECKFHIRRCKESTGRVVMWKEMLIKNSFTLEASFAGSSIVEKPAHFSIQDYEKFGQCICESLRQYLDILSDSARMEAIFMDITKCVLRKLDKDKIPLALLPTLYADEKQDDDSATPITSISDCLQALTQCHSTIYEQDASSESDSDSDPEGGELPEVPYQKRSIGGGGGGERGRRRRTGDESVDAASKKQSRKKRAERAIEERVQKLAHKREASDEHDGAPEPLPRTRLACPTVASETETLPQIKLTLAVDQMDRAARALPPRGTLFVSKYANRNGHGQPIFSTERALERKQKKIDAMLQELQANEYDADTEQNVFYIGEQSQVEPTPAIETNPLGNVSASKRIASTVSLTLNDLIYPASDQPIPTISGTYVSQPSISKTLPARRLRAERRLPHPLKPTSINELNQTLSIMEVSTSISPLPNLPPATTPVSGTAADASVVDSSRQFSFETQTDSNGVSHHRLHSLTDNFLSSLSKGDTQALRTSAPVEIRMPLMLNNSANQKRVVKPRPHVYATQQLLTPIEPVSRERSVPAPENGHQSNSMERAHRVLQQLHLPIDKSKRS